MTAEEDRLRRCTHHTMRVRGEPCTHWECVERNKAADRIDELEAAIDAWTARISSHPHNWADDEDRALLRLTTQGQQLLKERYE